MPGLGATGHSQYFASSFVFLANTRSHHTHRLSSNSVCTLECNDLDFLNLRHIYKKQFSFSRDILVAFRFKVGKKNFCVKNITRVSVKAEFYADFKSGEKV
jgi:hypothetical protein